MEILWKQWKTKEKFMNSERVGVYCEYLSSNAPT
jgi:hypothetical protein